MKKLFYPLFALAAMAMTTSCSDELENGTTNGNEANVSFKVQLENAVGSRLAGDGKTAKELHYAVYKAEDNAVGNEIEAMRGTATILDDLTAEVKFTLVKGQTYNFMFWAQSTEGHKYYSIDWDDASIDLLYEDMDETTDGIQLPANDENRDAFFKMRKDLKVNGPINETIVLKRPFAQVNVGTTIGSLAKAYTAELDITHSEFTFSNVATRLNTYNGCVGGEKTSLTFTSAAITESEKYDEEGDLKNVDDTDYEHLAMNYILVYDINKDENQVEDGSKKQLINGILKIYGAEVSKDAEGNDVIGETNFAEPINTFEIPNIPVQRNWRTNIIGDILTENVTFNIVVDPEFDNDHNYNTAKELAYIFASGGEVTLEEDLTVDAPFYRKGATGDDRVIKDATITLNLNGKTLTYTGEDIMSRLGEGATLIINGPGEIVASHYIASANTGGTVYVNDGKYSTEETTLFQANGGKIYVTGGEFSNDGGTYGSTFQFNHFDAEKNNGLIEISGGTFKGFNPGASASENPAMNFLKYGYTTTYDQTTDTYTVVEDKLEQLSMNGGTYQLKGDEVLDRALTVTKDLVIDLNGQKMTSTQSVWIIDVVSALVSVKEGATVTIKGGGTIDGSGTGDYAVETRGGKLIIENGEFIGETTAAYAVTGEIIIKGGTFSQSGWKDQAGNDDNTYVLNLKDKLGGKITVTGGTFKSFNPGASNSENPQGNFVADGYEATDADNDGNYEVGLKTVGNDETVTLTTDADFTNSIIVNGGTLDGDNYTLTQVGTPVTNLLVSATGAATIKNLNIVGANTAWDDNGTLKGPRALYFTSLDGDIVIENVTTSGVCYALNVNASSATKPSDLIVNNSTLAGWTSYGSGLTSATFNNVKFAFGSYFTADADKQSNGYCRPYVKTRFNGCDFENGFVIDEDINGSGTYPVIEFNNCTIGGVAITKENVSTLFEQDADLKNVTIIK